MARILAIDYGLKRVGLAVTDPLKMVANGLSTLPTGDILNFLQEYTSNEEVECIVVGLARRLHGEIADIEVEIQKFIKKLKEILPEITVVRVDERFTSKMASQVISESGISKKKKKEKGLIDKISATLILQSYLQQQDSHGARY